MGKIGLTEILLLSIIILPIIGWWKTFVKADKPGWSIFIPIYNIFVFIQIIGKPWWWLILLLIPYVNLIWVIWGLNLLAKRFGKSEGFTVGLVLLLPIFICILGMGKSKYNAPSIRAN